MKIFLKLIKSVWFWSGLILLISTIALFVTLFGSKVLIDKTYNGGSGRDLGVQLHKDYHATIYRTEKEAIPCYYSIEGNTIVVHSTPAWDRAFEHYERTFTIKNRFTLIGDNGTKWKADNISLIYIGEVMGISAFVFLHSGISAIKKYNKKKAAIQ